MSSLLHPTLHFIKNRLAHKFFNFPSRKITENNLFERKFNSNRLKVNGFIERLDLMSTVSMGIPDLAVGCCD